MLEWEWVTECAADHPNTDTHSLTPSLSYSQASSPHALDTLNQSLNVLQTVQLPFALVPLLAACANPAITGAMVRGGMGDVTRLLVLLV